MPGPVAVRGGSRPAVVNNLLSDLVLNPTLWRFILFAGQPVRLAIAANVLVGRSLRSLASELLRKLNDLVGWLYGRLLLRRLRGFDRRYFPVRRWHVAAAALVAARAAQVLLRRWGDHRSGRAARRRELQQRQGAAKEYQ